MAIRPILSTVAWVELGLATLLVFLFAVGFGIRESDDVWALGLSSVILAAAPVAGLVLNKFNGELQTMLATLFVASWPFVVWRLVVYA
jgi:hypothetical protein